MTYPFTPEQFFSVFVQYNTSVWPMQIVLYLAALAMVILLIKTRAHKAVATLLACYWLWMGIAYHWIFFSPINPAARIFAVFFVVEGLLLAYQGLVKGGLIFSVQRGLRTTLGLGLVAIGTVVYPVLGYFFDHVYPASPTFGLPCPTTIFTFGVLLLAQKPPRHLIIIPLLWSIIGFMAALSMGVTEDTLLPIAGATGFIFLVLPRANASREA